MEEVKQEVQEQQVEQTGQVEAKEEVQVEDKVEQVVEQPDPSLVDPESGKPWKELAKEYERKYHSTTEKLINYQRQPDKVVDPNEEIPATRAGIKQVLTEQQQEEFAAEQMTQNVIEDLSMTNPEIKQFIPEIEKQLKLVPASQRNSRLVELTAFAVYGQHKHKTYKPVESNPSSVKRIVSSKKSDVLPPSNKAGNISDVTLTEDENDYKWTHRLGEKGFTDEEVREQYQKYYKKK